MTDNTVFLKYYKDLPIRIKEILRYAGVREEDPQTEALLKECLLKTESILEFKVCFIELPVTISGKTVDFGVTKVESENLSKNLAGCERAIIFAATVGMGIDRLINRYSSLSPSKSFMFGAIGTERVESLCDAFCEDKKRELSEEGYHTRPRFSAGYGDLPLSFQKDIFSILEPQRCIGITLSGELIMLPSKSVTAIVGISK